MDDRFFEAWITRPFWRVCGLKLQPFCLGHVVNLAAVASPFLPGIEDPTPEVTPPQLLVAVRICAQSWPHTGDLRPRLRDIALRFYFESDLPGSRFFFRAQVDKFRAYCADHLSSPEFWKDSGGTGRTLTAPAALSKASYLITNGFSEERAWSMSHGRVDYYMAAIEERRSGQLRFLYPWDLEGADPLEQEMSEEQIVDLARAELPPEAFAEWCRARQQKGDA